MVEVICAIISAVASIIVVVLGSKINKSTKLQEKRAEIRKRESLLSLNMMSATLQLSIVSANALTGGHNNGNVEAARAAALRAENDYRQFEREVLSGEIGG